MKNGSGIPQTDLGRIIRVFQRYESVEEVVLYGSRAKGNYRPGSDVDLTLKGKKLDLKTLNRISNELDDLLLPYCIDISIYSQIENEDLIDHIRRVGVVLYRSSDASSRQTEQLD